MNMISKYRNITSILQVVVLLGGAKKISEEVAQNVMEVEKEIAEITMPDEERREDDKLYHLSTLAKLTEMAPFVRKLIYI